jgi:two-component system, NtrC family, C4-dicarboxylate transport sensor histidine kinase DctB
VSTSTRRHFFSKHARIKYVSVLMLMALVGGFFVYLLAEWSERKALVEAEEKARNVLDYQSSNLALQLNKFSLITALVSKRPDVVEFFRSRNTPSSIPANAADTDNIFSDRTGLKNDRLASVIAGLSGAKDFWFVDKKGDVFSASSDNLIGTNVKGQPYFEAALQGRLGRMSDADSNDLRTYIFASPVFVDQKVGGMVIVRANLDVVEYVWALLAEPIVASDQTGRVLLSNIPAWRLQSFDSLIRSRQKTLGRMGSTSKTKVDSQQQLTPAINEAESGSEGADEGAANSSIRQIQLQKVIKGSGSSRYIEVKKYLPLLQWTLHVLVDLAPVQKQKRSTIIISSLMVVLCLLSLWIIFERRRRLIERARSQQAFALRLERQVRDRTRELTESNSLLASEVVERRSAEIALRETQEDLLQAAKLAGIGQMSAALAHEYNQPLAAIRSYADNAKQLLVLEKSDAVSDNLTRITSLTERMANLTKTLRSFAHKADGTLAPVDISSVMDEMVILLSPQAKKQGAELIVIPPSKKVQVMAGHLRLSQVITNLISNAMDAIQHEHIQRVEVSWQTVGDYAEIYVKDSGQGIPDELKDKIFTPFFTTKGVGVGLGLGLFIVYNMVKEFQGTIEVKPEVGYGGVFCLRLPLV